jgi:hypothetical protein
MGKNQPFGQKGGSKNPKMAFSERSFEGFNGQKSAFWSKKGSKMGRKAVI